LEISLGRATQNFNCENELNEQINTEFNAANTYLSLVSIFVIIFLLRFKCFILIKLFSSVKATYFAHDAVGLEGFAKMYHHSYKEELGHADKLREYGIKRGSVVRFQDIQVSRYFLVFFLL
jgi:ferritin